MNQLSASQAASPLNIRNIQIEHLRQFAQAGFLYAVMDATGLEQIPIKARRLGDQQMMSLFKGTANEEYWAIAPYVARIDLPLLDWIKEELAEEPWGIFLMSNQPMDAIVQHCRGQLVVILADGQQWFFRYYDPRVLERHLTLNQLSDLKPFFGPVRSFVVTSGKDLAGKAFALSG